VTLPPSQWGERWSVVFDTATGWREEGAGILAAGDVLRVEGRSLVVLRGVS
jgi:hypothetical protein